jgi:hypothetical protein
MHLPSGHRRSPKTKRKKKNAETQRRICDYSNASNMPKKSKQTNKCNRAISRSRAKSCAVKPSRAFQI